LEKALMLQPYLKVLVTSGLYDLATPYKATEYTFDHLRLTPSETSRISYKEYEAGHMMYTHEGCLAQMTQDMKDWLKSFKVN